MKAGALHVCVAAKPWMGRPGWKFRQKKSLLDTPANQMRMSVQKLPDRPITPPKLAPVAKAPLKPAGWHG